MKPLDFDINLFLSLNGDLGYAIDQFMYIVSQDYTWIPLYLAVLIWAFVKKGWKVALTLLLLCAIAVALADQTATFMKHMFPKLRPTHYPPLEGLVHTVNGYLGGLYCTVSSHASNSLAFAIISSCFVRNKWYSIGISLWVIIICYSRIYLGVHYPVDIILGLVDGIFYSLIILFIYKKYLKSHESRI